MKSDCKLDFILRNRRAGFPHRNAKYLQSHKASDTQSRKTDHMSSQSEKELQIPGREDQGKIFKMEETKIKEQCFLTSEVTDQCFI